ncbi:MAG: hypothetical protein ACTSYR_02325, partial [Candidatus Odinarchaeia archaeon]
MLVFFSALTSFFKEAYGSDINELTVSEYKLFFFKVSEDVMVIILSECFSDVEEVRPLIEAIYSEVKDIIDKDNLNYINIQKFEKKLDKIITKLLKQKTKRAEVDNVPLDFYLYLESMISKGSADIIR